MKHFVSAALFIAGIIIVAADANISNAGMILKAIAGFAIIDIAYLVDKETIDGMNKEAKQ